MATYLGRFLVLAKLASEWSAANPVLMNGELGVADPGSSAPVLKVGDGVRPWSALPHISGAGGGGANDYVIGTTTTLAPGSFATATIDNTVDPPTISFGIPRGNTGPANTLTIGTVTTGAPGSAADATITGAAPNQTLFLTIPQGEQGEQGEPGADGATGATGADGPANELTIGTVTTGAPGSPAEASITGTPPSQVLNLTIPRGTDGAGLLLVNPTGEIGLTMVPGVATTAARSDSSPPLSQAISPTWTGTHVFNNPITVDGVSSADWWRLDSSTNTQVFSATGNGNGNAVINTDTANTTVTYSAVANALHSVNFGITSNLFAGALLTGGPSGEQAFVRTDAAIPLVFGIDGAAAGYISGANRGLVWGAATGGSQGAGTINATGLFVNGVAVGTSSVVAGDPTSAIGLTVVPGSAPTFMRSDAAPPINQAIAPTWTGNHSFSSGTPQLRFVETDQTTDEKNWALVISAKAFTLRAYDDAFAASRSFLTANRGTGVAITNVSIGDATGNPTYQFLGTGAATFGGTVSASPAVFATDVAVNTKIQSINSTLSGMVGTQSAHPLEIRTSNTIRATFSADGTTFSIASRILGQDGAAATPAYSFTNDPNTGIYSAAADTIGFAAGGSAVGTLSTGGAFAVVGASPGITINSTSAAIRDLSYQTNGVNRWSVRVNGTAEGGSAAGSDFQIIRRDDAGASLGAMVSATRATGIWAFDTGTTQVRVGDGSPSVPAIAFNADTNTGMYRGGTGDIRFATGGSIGLMVRAAQTFFVDGAAATPGMTFINDPDTGIYRGAANALSIAAGGAVKLGIGVSSITFGAVTVQGQDGTVGAPFYTFESDPDTGLYRGAANTLVMAAGATQTIVTTPTLTYLNAGVFQVPDGSSGAPSLSFNSDPDTGIYRITGNMFAFATGGVRRMYVYDAGFVPEVAVRFLDGLAATPALTFDLDTDTGFYRWGSDAFGATSGGAVVMSWRLGQSRITDGSAGTPALCFENDTNTGMYAAAADTLGFSTGGSVRLTLSNSAVTASVGVSAPSFTSTSSRAIKRETGTPRAAASILSRLRPIFYRLLAGDDSEQLGLIAEEVHEICPQLSDGKTIQYDRLAVLLLADWQESRGSA